MRCPAVDQDHDKAGNHKEYVDTTCTDAIPAEHIVTHETALEADVSHHDHDGGDGAKVLQDVDHAWLFINIPSASV